MLFQRCFVALRKLNTRWQAHLRPLCSVAAVSDSDVLLERALKDTASQEEPQAGLQRVLRAAILGVPNAGKTTLVNQLLGQKLFAVSPKRHTTTRKAVGVFTQGNSQVILIDTPGVIPYQVGRKLNAPKSFLTGPHRSLMEAELVMVVVDASDKRTREKLNPELLRALSSSSHIPAILLLNKVDAVRHKHVLLQVTESLIAAAEKWTQEERRRREERNQRKRLSGETDKLTETVTEEAPVSTPETSEGGSSSAAEQDSVAASIVEKEAPWPQTQEDGSLPTPVAATVNFREVFMVSALTGDGVEDLREYLLSCARPGLWEYSVAVQSDQSQLALVEDIVREKLFLHLHREIPYVVTQSNVLWEKEGDTMVIYQNLTCRSSSQASIVIGPAGRTVQAITADARENIEALLGCPVDLTLNIRTQK